MKYKKMLAAAAATVAIAIGFVWSTEGLASEGKGAGALEGTWRVRLTPTYDPNVANFDEFMTFAAGGGIVESNNYPFHLLPPSGLSAGPGHGSWKYAGNQQFPFTFEKFLFAPGGQAAGILKVVGTITYSQANDTWSGPANVQFCNALGANCQTIDVTNGQATRISPGQ